MIMASRPATVGPAETLRVVAQELAAADIGAVLVESPGGPTGVVSERDLVTVLASGDGVDDVQAGEIMTTDLVAADADDTIATTGRIMLEAGVRHVPVRKGGAVVGLVSIRDVLAVLLTATTG
jgi:CBS domain-containing protein